MPSRSDSPSLAEERYRRETAALERQMKWQVEALRAEFELRNSYLRSSLELQMINTVVCDITIASVMFALFVALASLK